MVALIGRQPSEPRDQPARLEIQEDLERNILVEAGAGSGKTTALVKRMVALVRSRTCSVEQIAAVTFTRKAAAELRQRFQEELEKVARALPQANPERDAVDDAIRGLTGAFLGTIHAFCARLLRERPLEAGLDPGFREMMESEASRMQSVAWIDFLERMASDGDVRLERLERMGIAPDRLRGIYDKLVENPDVDFGFDEVEPPGRDQAAQVRHQFDELLDDAKRLLPPEEPTAGWDPFARRVRTLLYWRRALDWQDPNVFFEALARIYRKKSRPVQKRWGQTRQAKQAAKELGERFTAFGAEGGAAASLLEAWWAYRYPVAIGVAKSAADAFAAERKERGTLTYQDLLVLTAELLREHPDTRRDLGKRYSRVLVDEFQDTDPLQAEILLLLASDPGSSGAGARESWTHVVPRPGALFVVGDPKQSIYRFRRADIALYDFVKERFKAFGKVLRLETNFRSLPVIADLVKGVFDRPDRFPSKDTDRQAAFAPLRSWRGRDAGERGKVVTYSVRAATNSQMAERDAAAVALLIARRVHAGERRPGDFMVLTRYRPYPRPVRSRTGRLSAAGRCIGFRFGLRKGAGRVRPPLSLLGRPATRGSYAGRAHRAFLWRHARPDSCLPGGGRFVLYRSCAPGRERHRAGTGRTAPLVGASSPGAVGHNSGAPRARLGSVSPGSGRLLGRAPGGGVGFTCWTLSGPKRWRAIRR